MGFKRNSNSRSKFKRSNAKRTRFASRKKTRRTMRRNLTSVRAGVGFPKRMVMTHKYRETGVLVAGPGILTNKLWSCNNLYDPYFTAAGHQPMYFDQMAAIYDHYTVIGSKFKVQLIPGTTASDMFGVGIHKNDDTTVLGTTIEWVAEQSESMVKYVAPGSSTATRLTSKWSAKKTFGGSILGNDNLQGTSSAGPTEQTYYVLSAQDNTTAAPVPNIYYIVEIDYIAVWDELKDVAQS